MITQFSSSVTKVLPSAAVGCPAPSPAAADQNYTTCPATRPDTTSSDDSRFDEQGMRGGAAAAHSRKRPALPACPTRHRLYRPPLTPCCLPQVLGEVQGPAGAVAVALLNRPRALNSLSTAMVERLLQLYRRWDADPRVSCILLKASGALWMVGQQGDPGWGEQVQAPAISCSGGAPMPESLLACRAAGARPFVPEATSRRWCCWGRGGAAATR